MLINCLLTAYALICFMTRMVVTCDIDVKNQQEMEELYQYIYSDEERADYIYKYFGDEKMIKTFPRLKIETAQNEVIYFSDILNHIQPYYYKIWEESENK